MDIASLSIALSNQQISSSVDLAVTKLGLENMEQMSANLIEDMKAMELSVNPNVGSHIDLSI